jgi:diguanylate cyclase (GGDEF)-like protein
LIARGEAAEHGKPASAVKRWLSRATEPRILYPAIAVVVLALIWAATLALIRDERAAARHTAGLYTRELAATYEAQVVRALREIDQTLKFVKAAYEFSGRRDVLEDLKARVLLPADLLFVVSILDDQGEIVASTRPAAVGHAAGRDYFWSQREADALWIGRPRLDPGSGEWKLRFSRALHSPGGTFSGVAMLEVDAAYFVSGYEASKLGAHGVLAILGSDGVFLAMRSGEAFSAGGTVDYATVVPAPDEAAGEAALAVNPWDGAPRYTSARKLYEFPLAVIVGLSADEQLATARRQTRAYLWRAAGGSLLLIVVLAVLGRMSRQLESARLRVIEEHVAHAARIEFLAYHDVLTQLPNRSLFSKLLGQSISQARRYDRQLALLFLDLDRFKHINDTLGHEAGDQLLREVATRLKACLRDSDAVARLGGDEFVALLPQLEEEKYVATVARKILAAVGRPFLLLGQEVSITASIGISTYPRDGLDEQSLTSNADSAMYRAKQAGKNNFQFYSDSGSTLTLPST